MAEQSNKLVETCRKIVASPAFNQLILALIVLSGVLIGMETYPRFDVHTDIGKWLQVLQNIILAVFVAEVVIKIAAHGSKPWDYFRNPWNIFDFTIVAVSLLPLGGRQFVMVFRMARLLRALRLLTMLPRLQILVSALLKSIPALGYVGILLLLHFYIYAVMGTFLFRDNDPIRFGNLPRSMLSLFQVVTLEGWNDVLHTQMFGSKVGTTDYYPEAWQNLPEALNRVPKGHPVAAPLYFVSFIMLGTMIMLNLFTGVIIGSMQEAEDQSSGKVADEVEAHIKELEEKGFLTLREELELVALKLKEVADDVAALNEQTRQFRPERVAAAGDRSGDDGV
ncbi:MAG TPA: ion transporter [Lacipirellulaceae bacterium]|nr:ion transporter [Lacipirellulaceae bacterium]